jgi:spoIIIJ-associated protein
MESTAPVSPSPSPAPQPLNPREVLQTMLDGLGLQTTVEQDNIDGTTLLRVATPEPGRLIGRHGQTLSQLQFLVNRILQRGDATAPKVTVDCEHYRERQRDEVVEQVRAAADKVRRWGEPVHIGPYNAFDRRAIHQLMLTDPELEAVSEDELDGGMKKMTLRLRTTPPAAPAAPAAPPPAPPK